MGISSRQILLIGAAAGVAAYFRAPLAGTILAVEGLEELEAGRRARELVRVGARFRKADPRGSPAGVTLLLLSGGIGVAVVGT